MAETIKDAFDAGYSHVYTTDAVYMSAKSNVWGSVPSYLLKEAIEVRSVLAQKRTTE